MYRIVATVLGVLVAMAFEKILSSYNKKRKEREFHAWSEKRRREDEDKAKENASRTAMRKQHYSEQPPVLHYNTVAGITAVMTPYAYEKALKSTRVARSNETWQNEKVLSPSVCRPFIFLTLSGKKTVHAATTKLGYTSEMYRWYSELQELVEECNINLVYSPDIFVPYVNDTLTPFTEQDITTPGYGCSRSLEGCLIGYNVPEEMRDLDW
jgi:hypothetical protein